MRVTPGTQRRIKLSSHGAVCLCALILFGVGACAPVDTGYFPVASGYEWAYDISRKTAEMSRPLEQKSIMRNLPRQLIEGVAYYPKIHANGKTYYFTRSEAGVGREAPDTERAELIIGYPLQVGHEWRAVSGLYLFDLPKKLGNEWGRLGRNLELDYEIASLTDQVEVPAGYFPRCLRVDASGILYLPHRLMLGVRIIKVEQSQWYAPGVGLVKMTRKEYAIPNLYPSEYTQELASFTRGRTRI